MLDLFVILLIDQEVLGKMLKLFVMHDRIKKHLLYQDYLQNSEKNDNTQLMKERLFRLNEEMNEKQDLKDSFYQTTHKLNSITVITSSILSISSFNRSIACTNGLCVEIDEIEIGGYCGTGGAPWIGLSIDVLLSIDVSELSSGFLFCLVGIVVVSVIRNGRYTT